MEADCHAKGFMHATSHVSDPLPAAGRARRARRAGRGGARTPAPSSWASRLAAGLRYLQDKHEIIGDVRGFGLLQGVELVKDRETRAPDAATGRAITQPLHGTRPLHEHRLGRAPWPRSGASPRR